MGVLAAITLASTVIKHTGLGSWISEKIGDNFGEQTAQKITQIAQIVTGENDPQRAVELVVANKSFSNQVKQEIVKQEHELKKLYLADVAGARELYAKKNTMADKIAERIIKWNLWAVLLLLIANLAVAHFITNPIIAVALGNLIGGSISSLWQERLQIISFFFGSSMGSKEKDAFNFNPVK